MKFFQGCLNALPGALALWAVIIILIWLITQ